MRTATVIAVLSFTALAGCRDTTGPADLAPIRILSPLALSTTLSSATMAPGGSLTITTTVTNVSNTTVTLTDYACNTRFVLSLPNGITITPYRNVAGCDAVLDVRTLAPHASASFSQAWDGSVLLSGDTIGPAPAGQYAVLGNGVYGPVRSNLAAKLTVLP